MTYLTIYLGTSLITSGLLLLALMNYSRGSRMKHNATSPNSMQQRILEALRDGPLSKVEIAEAVGLKDWQAVGWLLTLREEGLIRLTSEGLYEVAYE